MDMFFSDSLGQSFVYKITYRYIFSYWNLRMHTYEKCLPIIS